MVGRSHKAKCPGEGANGPLERVARFGRPPTPLAQASPLPQVWSDFQRQAEGSVPPAPVNEAAEMNMRKVAACPGDTGDPLEKTLALFPPLRTQKSEAVWFSALTVPRCLQNVS